MTVVSTVFHPVPLYFVETDLVAEYLPAARELATGVLNMSHYSFKGPGYPLLLALIGRLLHGDFALAARVVSPISAGVSVWLSFRLARRLVDPSIATFTLAAMMTAPVVVRYAVEAGTDMPALALMLTSTYLVLVAPSPVRALFAGLLCGCAVLTRSNAIFLVPCSIVLLLFQSRRAANVLGYVLAFAAPLGLWSIVASRHGGFLPDRNYLNVAWELYGRGLPWDRFEATTGTHFHSMLQVLSYDPARAAMSLARNLFGHRLLDLRELSELWIGIPALPGGFLLWSFHKKSRPWLAFAGVCALTLAPVFYSSRFGLYLLPVYVTAAGAAFHWLAVRLGSGSPNSGSAARLRNLVAASLTGAAVLASAVTASVGTTRRLADAPVETRAAGGMLARRQLSGQRIMARKPHVGYYAGMAWTPLPVGISLAELPRHALAESTQFLFFSGIEQVMRPTYAVLADSGLSLPGFEQILWRRFPHDHFGAVYRLHATEPDSGAFAADYRLALLRYEEHRPGSPEATMFVAAQLIALGEPKGAIRRLDALVAGGARDAAVERLRASAKLAVGDIAGAADACERAMQLEQPGADLWAQLGYIRARQGRLSEAAVCLGKAVAIEPLNLDHLTQLGRLQILVQNYSGAASTFERAVRLAPKDASLRRLAMGAWQLAGNSQRFQTLYDEGVASGISPGALLGDSISSR